MSDVPDFLGSDNAKRPTLDEVTTVLWTVQMGQRLSLARMKLCLDQRELGLKLGISQAAVSRIEIGQSRVCEKVSVAKLKEVLPQSFPFIVFGSNAERWNAGTIARRYWETKLRINRKIQGGKQRGRH